MGFIGDIFGKGGGDNYAPPPPQMPDYSGEMMAMMGMMSEMMGGIMEGMAAQTAQMMEQAGAQQEQMFASMQANMPGLPEAYRDPVIDFSEQQDKIASKAKADYHLDELRRKGVADTVLTSPLLDEEDPELGGSILTGDS